MQPQYCSIYDRDFWRHERYWKVPSELYLQAFNGTPFKNVIWRLLGVRLGRRVFDDGCYMTERTLSPSATTAPSTPAASIQCHSQEDGAFKSDRTTIGAGCTLGVGAFVHYGVTMGDGAVLAADSFLMKGEEVPPRALGRKPRHRATPPPASGPTPAIRLVSPEPGRRSLTLWSVPAVWITLPVALTTLIWVPQVMPDLRNAVLEYLGVVPGAPPTGPVALLFQWLLPVLAGLALLALVIGAVSWASRTAPPDAEPVWSGPLFRRRRTVRAAGGTITTEPDRPGPEPVGLAAVAQGGGRCRTAATRPAAPRRRPGARSRTNPDRPRRSRRALDRTAPRLSASRSGCRGCCDGDVGEHGCGRAGSAEGAGRAVGAARGHGRGRTGSDRDLAAASEGGVAVEPQRPCRRRRRR